MNSRRFDTRLNAMLRTVRSSWSRIVLLHDVLRTPTATLSSHPPVSNHHHLSNSSSSSSFISIVAWICRRLSKTQSRPSKSSKHWKPRRHVLSTTKSWRHWGCLLTTKYLLWFDVLFLFFFFFFLSLSLSLCLSLSLSLSACFSPFIISAWLLKCFSVAMELPPLSLP